MAATTPQLLPFHIEHDGPAPIDTYFRAEKDEHGNKIAAFRGRVVYGVDLALPEGYAGVILQTGEDNQNKTVQKKPEVIDVDVEEEDTSGTRLGPGLTFDTIGLWRADVPVDATSDEYARALNEWTKMAALIHNAEGDDQDL